jgi:signal transduction histidine kinase
MNDSTDLARLLSLIAHELRTPLSVTSGYVKMLATERPGPLNDAQRNAIRGAGRSADHMTALATDISLLGRIERGEVQPEPVAIDLPAVLAELVSAHTVNPDHPVNVELAPAPNGDAAGSGSSPALHADAAHLRRALNALLAAMVRMAPDEATLHVGWRIATGSPATMYVGIAIADRLESLLDAEASALAPLDETQGGLGVSLPLARRLMALEGGAIHGLPAERQTPGLRLALPLAASPDSAAAR